MPRLSSFSIDSGALEGQQFLDELYANPTELQLKNIKNQESIPWSFLFERFPKLQHLTANEKEGGSVLYDIRTRDIAEDLEISNCHRLTILAPYSPLFRNLADLRIFRCDESFPHLLTSSTARGLVQLISLSIEFCKNLKGIVAYDGDEEDGKNRAKDDAILISFPRLKRLRLLHLQSLRSFSSTNYKFNFPSLMDVQMMGLPNIRAFCEGDFVTPYKHRITRDVRALHNKKAAEYRQFNRNVMAWRRRANV